MDQKFQVNLRGIIDLLSHHLYSSPQVFIRELLQNATDAIRARQLVEPGFTGSVQIEVTPTPGDGAATLSFIDDGIGLTAAEAERFLAVIGESSKRGDLGEARNDFIGQFGIGLLSCFVVSEQIVVLSRSVKPQEPAIEWKGSSDGTYSLRRLSQDISPGTRVFLRSRPDTLALFDADAVRQGATHYGSMLPFPIRLTTAGQTTSINQGHPPWQSAQPRRQGPQLRDDLLAYGRQMLGGDYLDAIPLKSRTGGIEGVAYVLPTDEGISPRLGHRVYLKSMFLTESGEGLLPDWAFFIRCILNVQTLRPTASREGFYKDAALERARQSLGKCLRDYLVDMAGNDPGRLGARISRHHRALKAMAVQDDEFYAIVIEFLPFETTLGTMSLRAYRDAHGHPRFVASTDEFRQVAHVAAAQGLCLINAGYSYDRDLLAKLPRVLPGTRVEQVGVADLVTGLAELTFNEQQAAFDFIERANRALARFDCRVELRKFQPAQLASLYTASDEMRFRRTAEQTMKSSDRLWAAILESVVASRPAPGDATLCFNYANALVRRLAAIKDGTVVDRIVPLLYAQSLMMGRHPLSAAEMELLNNGILTLVEWGLAGQTG